MNRIRHNGVSDAIFCVNLDFVNEMEVLDKMKELAFCLAMKKDVKDVLKSFSG